MLFSEDKKAIIEALLFVAVDPLKLEQIAEIGGLSSQDANLLLKEISENLKAPDRGLCLTEVAEGFRLVTKAEYSEYVEKLLKPQASSLSHAALETLAIVAYRQPVTRAEVEQIRGVKVDSVLNSLMKKNLIREVGRKESVGRPIMYGTTNEFLIHFGLKSLADLPPLDDKS